MTKLQTKSIKHTFKRDGRFYFSRRIPNDLADHYRVQRIVCALGTSCPSTARKHVAAAVAELDAYWATLRLTRMTAIGHNLRVENFATAFQALPPNRAAVEVETSITMTEARDLYLRHKSKGRSPTFKNAAERTTAYLIAACDDKPLNRYSRSDALLFRDHLVERGLSGSSITRNLSHTNAIINFAISENAIEMNNPFSGVYYDREAGVKERQPIPVKSIRRVQAECRAIDDDMRWLIALVSDTGMRLAEAAGLAKADLLDLYGEHPHIHVRKYPWRSLKTKSSERLIPICGEALWAAKRIIESSEKSDFAFPRYNKRKITAANSASGALNKWLGQFVPNGCSMHGFRHSMRDRLRAVECPSEIVDQIGGWASGSVGKAYGNGYTLDVTYSWMKRATEDLVITQNLR